MAEWFDQPPSLSLAPLLLHLLPVLKNVNPLLQGLIILLKTKQQHQQQNPGVT